MSLISPRLNPTVIARYVPNPSLAIRCRRSTATPSTKISRTKTRDRPPRPTPFPNPGFSRTVSDGPERRFPRPRWYRYPLHLWVLPGTHANSSEPRSRWSRIPGWIPPIMMTGPDLITEVFIDHPRREFSSRGSLSCPWKDIEYLGLFVSHPVRIFVPQDYQSRL